MNDLPSPHLIHAELAGFIEEKVATFLGQNTFACSLAEKIYQITGTHLIDWVDYLAFPYDEQLEKMLEQWGMERIAKDGLLIWGHKSSTLPIIWLIPRSSVWKIAIKVDSVTDFVIRNRVQTQIEGDPYSASRRAMISEENECRLHAIERRISREVYARTLPQSLIWKFFQALDLWRTRRRLFEDDLDGIKQTLALVYRLVDMIGQDLASHAVFQVEKEYWQVRCQEGDWQKFFQDKLGLGWSNQDHFILRSQRKTFKYLIQILETVGFSREQRWYNEQEGYGAQLLVNRVSNLQVVVEVDLTPEETSKEFTRTNLSSAREGGVIEKWTSKYGDSLLQGGLYSLAIRCDFSKLQENLKKDHIYFREICNSPFFKKAITPPSIEEQAHQEYYLQIVERKQGFEGFTQANYYNH